ncbi:MAG: NAD-glutamate dehydrogenase [Maricaulaceae bacterium]
MSRLSFSLKVFKNHAVGLPALKCAKSEEEARGSFLAEFYKDAEENQRLRPPLDVLARWAGLLWKRRNIDAKDAQIDITDLPEHPDYQAVFINSQDKSFIVASVIEAVSALGLDVQALFHPIATLKGQKASMILIVITRQDENLLAQLSKMLRETMSDVDLVNNDFDSMIALLKKQRSELVKNPGPHKVDEQKESLAFLDWLEAGHFVFLGARRYNYLKSNMADGPSPDYVNPALIRGGRFGVLRDSSRQVLRQSNEPSVIADNLEQYLKRSAPVSVAKSNLFSNVHRRVRMDYVSVNQYNEAGDLIGETRFVGLFTSEAYNISPEKIPLVRQKIKTVKARSKTSPDSHNGKRLAYVLATYPRDELFQITTKDLSRIAIGVSQAFDRPRTRLFLRHDPFNRFVSALVYVPRETYSTKVRGAIGDYLAKAFNGRVSAFYPQYSDAPMARVHYIIGLDPDAGRFPKLDKLEGDVARLATPWADQLKVVAQTFDLPLVQSAANIDRSFDAAYKSRFSVQETLQTLSILGQLTEELPIAVRLGDMSEDGTTHMIIYHRGKKIAPSVIVPFLANFDIQVSQETAYNIFTEDTDTDYWVHDFEVLLPGGLTLNRTIRAAFETTFVQTWLGKNEDDSFNSLIIPQAADWRDIAFLRLIAAYRRQSGLDPLKATQVEALKLYPDMTRQLIALKTAKFALDFGTLEERETAISKAQKAIESGLGKVKRLDHDRVLRRMAAAITAALRTNMYQLSSDGKPKSYMSVKFNSRDIEDLPAPKPYREIFVSSPVLNGVHLRFGPVARGGLRWSDRPEDFRAEVLGLVKAQQVKNSVIVPVGSKGGFFPKQLPVGGTRDDYIAAGVKAYKLFISGLLDITDNYVGRGVQAPPNCICWDDPDPYLVVAADKGTATFSDIANGVASDYGYWLDDAFASGGSVGYDHKVMGITARGGWEAVKRHFRERGKNIQKEPFSVIGVGDMSGDVFGNGMLLSKKIRLKAAFDHRNIFIDPDPDIKKTYRERARLFKKGRSSWADYNQDLISKGGGIFSRADKSITLSPQIQSLTGLGAQSVTPDELIHALLKSECELLWFGGIGTYIKASHESHADAMDKTNDGIRVNAAEVGAAVIGEGANLGLTQAGRIEFAHEGGAVNTDAIDNSAGVDSSDNEVNIKILLSEAITQGELKPKARNKLLADMTDDVGRLVLKHNYDQTGALSVAQHHAQFDHGGYERLMRLLETDGLLDRAVEGLPSTSDMDVRRNVGQYLTRPEIAVLMAYVKNVTFDDFIKTNIANDPALETLLVDYFPPTLLGFKKAQKSHRLRREIIISRLVNDMVDMGGPLFGLRVSEQVQTTADVLAKTFMIARKALGLDNLLAEIAALDNKVPAAAQIAMQREISNVVLRVSVWLARNGVRGPLESHLTRFMPIQDLINNDWTNHLSAYDQKRAKERQSAFEAQGVPYEVAMKVSLLRSRASGFDLTRLGEESGIDIHLTPNLFYQMGAVFWVDRIRNALFETIGDGHWDRLALRKLADDFYVLQRKFAAIYVKDQMTSGDEIVSLGELRQWSKQRFDGLGAYFTRVRNISATDNWSVAKFSILYAQLQEVLK